MSGRAFPASIPMLYAERICTVEKRILIDTSVEKRGSGLTYPLPTILAELYLVLAAVVRRFELSLYNDT